MTQPTQVTFYCGNVEEVLPNLADESVHCCVTSPPYFGLRDYGVDGQVGLEDSPQTYIDRLVGVFSQVRRVLRQDGTLWLNLGDSYAANRGYQVPQSKWKALDFGKANTTKIPDWCKAKDLLGIPWMLAFALRADGWYLRSDIIWHKPNPMPESVKDRPTKAHEHLFLLAKSAKYYYDADAIREPSVDAPGKSRGGSLSRFGPDEVLISANAHRGDKLAVSSGWRNRRDVWTITPQPYKGAHFATFPPKLIEPCILAGCPEGGTVLDPFIGSGTTAVVATRCRRNCIGVELNHEYIVLAQERLYREENGK